MFSQNVASQFGGHKLKIAHVLELLLKQQKVLVMAFPVNEQLYDKFFLNVPYYPYHPKHMIL